MKSNKELLNNILNNSIEGIILIKDGFITDINQSLVEILKYESKNELIGNLVTGVLIPNINTKYIKYESRTYQELNIITKNGETIPVLIKIIDLDKRNKVAYILNLSELKEKEKLLITKSKHSAMGEMISMIAHQWRQPLNTLSSIVSKIYFRNHTNRLDKESIENSLNDINNQIVYMSNTIDDFRNFFSKEKNKEYIDLYEITKLVIKMIHSDLDSNDIKIKLEKKNNLSKIFLYKNDLIQVILNILNNSKDAFIENKITNKNISIIIDENEKFQTIVLKDNAGGINKDIIDHVFNPYFSTKSDRNGTGLGLYICKTIIEKKLNGQIYINSLKNKTEIKIEIEK
jgi:PAS domain S-box-containing protein